MSSGIRGTEFPRNFPTKFRRNFSRNSGIQHEEFRQNIIPPGCFLTAKWTTWIICITGVPEPLDYMYTGCSGTLGLYFCIRGVPEPLDYMYTGCSRTLGLYLYWVFQNPWIIRILGVREPLDYIYTGCSRTLGLYLCILGVPEPLD